ncbi:MAG: glycosyltransferase family 4 protein, partial [Actinomycetales bacterium]
MVQSLLAPVHEWDAIICSSPSLRSTVIDTIDRWEAYLRQHLGAPLRLPRPQLPIIGFGTDVGRIANLAADGAARVRRRTQLGIGPDEVMIFSLGRLSYVDKAFPQAMFKAVHQAQQEGTGGVHFVMAGWFSDEKADRDRYQQAAERYCPQVRVSFIDGNDQQAIGECWAAADVFLLLSDTIIETFGQALVEAMAAGLPLVVSDWDGYRWIVRDRVDGFLIPTLGAAPGPVGEALAMLEYTESIGYAQYSGAVSAHTAVDVMAAGAALSRLIASPALRRELGEAARSRAQQHFDWPVIVDQYARLFDDLAERRAWSEPAKRSAALNPLRDDPFASFRLLPTAVMTDEVTIRRGAVDSP